MKRLRFILLLCLLITNPLPAASGEGSLSTLPTLRVAVDKFSPPFVMPGANNQLFGFDISMMLNICKAIRHNCVFRPMPFKELLNAIAANEVDAAVSSIIITRKRAAEVNFSMPYLVSYSRFIGPSNLANKTFGLEVLNGRNIGVEEGTLFPEVIQSLGVHAAKIINYPNTTALIDALQQNKVHLALMDAPSTVYWEAQSSGILFAPGERFAYGSGLGIAVSPENNGLLLKINKALFAYQNSPEFKRDYENYLGRF